MSAALPAPPFVRACPGGTEVDVLVQPRAARTQVVGLHDGRLKIALQAPPVDGAANEALVEFAARLFGVAKKSVQLLRGDTSRRKTLLVGGLAPLDALARLPEAAGGTP